MNDRKHGAVSGSSLSSTASNSHPRSVMMARSHAPSSSASSFVSSSSSSHPVPIHEPFHPSSSAISSSRLSGHHHHQNASSSPVASPPRQSLRRSLPSSKTQVHAIDEGDFVWVHDIESVCIPATVIRIGFVYDHVTDEEKSVVIVHTEDGEERELRDQTLIKLPQCHHPKQLPSLQIHDLSSLALMATNGDIGRNEFFTDTQLENMVLYTIRARYRMEEVYTWIDRVLISVNPITPLPIFTPNEMLAFKSSSSSSPDEYQDQTKPHVFAVAQNAIRCMQDAAEDQAILLLGPMGAGKSEAAKLIVQYLCEIGENPSSAIESDTSGVLHPIGQQILHAFTILEAFGNAATHQNRNASRFSKMISVEFSKHGYVIGGGFTTHYFEKSRIVECQYHTERNFHVLYQVLAGVQHDPNLRDALELNRVVQDFALLKHADPSLTNPALDARDYRDLMSSFSALRIRKNQRMEILRILAALLHLGNVEFVPEDPKASSADSSCALADPSQIVLAAKLLEVEPVVLDNYFRTRQFFSKDTNNKTVSSLKVVTVHQARKARDTFIRSLYEALFTFLVETLNGILGGIFDRYEKSNIVIQSQGVHVLDMVGFENLETNGFEQLCCNYWSEKVQDFYLRHTLSDISDASSTKLPFAVSATSDETLQLFENVPFGIFALVNDHSKVRAPNDEDLVAKIIAGNEALGSVSRPAIATTTDQRLPTSNDWRLLFVVRHYCGNVTYHGANMAMKNTLAISSTCAAIMQSSKNAVLHAVGAAQVAANDKRKDLRASSSKFRASSASKDSKSIQETAASDVLGQADALLHALHHTGKNFVICIKPNDRLEDGVLDSTYVHQQLRQMQLVKLIKASRSIFSVQLSFPHFFRRYKSICGHRGTVESLLRSLSAIGVLEEEKYVVGSSKISLTSHQSKKLEKARQLYLHACASMIQRTFRQTRCRRQASQIVLVLKSLKQAMQRTRDPNELIQHLADCHRVLGSNAHNLRLLEAAKQLIAQCDHESYVRSIHQDAQAIHHPVLMEYVNRVMKSCTPWLSLDQLDRKESSTQRRLSVSCAHVHAKLRQAIVAHDPETLMATLATFEETTSEALERKLATMMIIRSLEEKSAIDAITSALKTLNASMTASAILTSLRAPVVKMLRMGLEHRLQDLSSQLPVPVPVPVTLTFSSSMDRSGLWVALEKAYEEENVIAMHKISQRIEQLSLPANDLLTAVERKLASELHTISSHAERKQIVKFLQIAKLANDVELLSQAIDAAIETGLAKWDFNLKNAQRERDRLLQEQEAQPTAQSDGLAWLLRLWNATTVDQVLALQQTHKATDYKDLVDAKHERLQLVQTVEARIERALSATSFARIKLIEEAFEKAISTGVRSPKFGALFDAYDQHPLASSSSNAPVIPSSSFDGLMATMTFLQARMDRNAELRDDALQLLNQQLQQAAAPSASVFQQAEALRHQVEQRIATRVRLETLLQNDQKPHETESIDAMQSSEAPATPANALAFSQFHQLRGYHAQSEQTLARKLCWDGRSLTQSLLAVDDPMLSSLALAIHRCILGYMRDRIVLYRAMLAQYILQIGVQHATQSTSIVDEIYVQLMKQLTKNPKRDSSMRGWSLFAMCASSFAPSDALRPYVVSFLKAQVAESNSFWRLVKNFASFALQKLENLVDHGASGFLPSLDEIRGYEVRSPFLAKIELLDGTVLADRFPVTPDMTVDQLIDICAHVLGLNDRVTKLLGLSAMTQSEKLGNETETMDTTKYFHKFLAITCFLQHHVFLSDLFEKELIRGRELRLVLKIRLWPLPPYCHDDMFDRLMFLQLLDELLKGNVPLLEEASVVRLAALALAIDFGSELPATADALLTEHNVLEYVPMEWQDHHVESGWAERICLQVAMLEDVENASGLQRVFIDEVARHRLYGAVFFPSKLYKQQPSVLVHGVELPSYFVLAVNAAGMHFIGRDGTILISCDYGEMLEYGGTYHRYVLCLLQADSTTEVVMSIKFPNELTDLLSDYKELTAHWRDA